MATHKLPAALLLLTLSLLPQAQGLTSTTLTLAVSPAPSVLGAPVTLSATVTPINATGKVTFYDGVTVLGTKTLSGGSASFLTGLLPSGSRKLRAYYAGDSGNAAAASNVVTQVVSAKASSNFATTGFAVPLAIVGDFNGDGIADLVSGGGGNPVTVHLGKGDGKFRSITALTFGQPMVVGDFNGDGKADVVVMANANLVLLAGKGDGTFQPDVTILSFGLPVPVAVVVADFNGDGNADLAYSILGGLDIMLGKGDGTFQFGLGYATGVLSGGTNVLAVGDFNGDGKPDLAVGGSAIAILLGMGDGTFQAPLNDPGVTSLNTIAVGDINQDGKSDLVILSSSPTNKVAIQLGNGDGTFRSPVSYALGFTPVSVAVADLNGDGTADLAVGSFTSFSVLPGDGGGTFGAPINYTAFSYYGLSLIAVEFNGDGKTDLLFNGLVLLGTNMTLAATGGAPQSTPVGTTFPIQLQATLRDGGNPVSGAPVGFTCPTSPCNAVLSATTATTDSSGVARVTATANQQPGSYAVSASSQGLSASFSLTNTIGPPAILSAASGTPQSALLGASFAAPLKVKLTDSAGNPSSGVTVTFTSPSAGATAMLSSSVVQTDSSGAASVTATAGSIGGAYTVTANFGSLSTAFSLTNVLSSTVTLAASPKPSTFGAPVTLTASVTPTGATGKVTFYDGITVLGTRPLASGTASLSTILLPTGTRKLSAYYSGDTNYIAGTATFTQMVKSVPAVGFSAEGLLSLGSISPTGIAVGDFNGDGKADLAIPGNVSGNAGIVTILLGKGDGTFQPPVSYPVPSAVSIAIADFNGDGNLDIAVANYQNIGGFSLLLGNGDGTFRSAINYSLNGRVSSTLVATDFNEDGKPDLLVSNVILLGNGDGTFQAPLTISNAPPFQTITLGDFNGDGKLDVVTASPFLEIAFGNGDGTFQPFSQIANSTSVSSPLAVGDFNGDGNLDLAVSISNGTSVLLGNGDGTFQSPISLPFGGFLIAASDFNGDGIGDLAITNLGSNTVSLLQGNGDGTFHLALSYTTTGSLQFLTAADFNGDGRVDLVGTNYSAPSGVAILLGVSSGVSLTVTSGSPQAAVSGAPFAIPLQVTVVQDGTPLNGAIVNFTAPTTGAGAVLSTTTAVTNTSGVASVNATANGVAGSYAVTATYKGSTVSFSLTNNALGSVIATGGTPQYTLINSQFPKPLEVTVRDSAGNPAYGVTVTFTTPISGASLLFPPDPVVTDASGVARVSVNANGTVGSYTVTASAGGQSASFSLSNTTIKVVFASGGAPQSAPVGTTFPTPLQVIVLDSSGNPVNNYAVSFSAPQIGASSGLFGNPQRTVNTNAAGVAYVIATANNTPGTYTITASISGPGTNGPLLASFSLTNLSSGSAVNNSNLARGKSAIQSSTLPGYPSANASSAVDGSTDGNFFDGSVTHTNLDSNAWWQVDLGASAVINSIVIWNRTDCCSSRLNGFWVFVSDTPFSSTDTVSTLVGRPGTWSSPPATPNPSTTISVNTQGRYVRVQLNGTNNLSLAEVQVFGTLLSSNLAPGKLATQSSTLTGYPSAGPASAADGNTDGSFLDRSVTHTNLDSNAWWQVDLGASAAVNTIVVWNRTDCCSERLNDYWVFVSDTPFLPTDTPATLQNRTGTFASHQAAAPNPFTVIPAAAQGRYVRVQLSGTNNLSLAEVQVFGTGGASTPTDLALGQSATQSSTLPGYSTAGPGSAIDGNTNGNFFAGSVTHTNFEANAWWQVDLGASATVNSIVVWNRTDCCSTRLSDYWVFVSDTPFASTDTPATLQFRAGTFNSHQVGTPNPFSIISVGVQGRYVRVQLSGANNLSLSEVQVFGTGGLVKSNLAFGRPVAQSSTLPGYSTAGPGGAVDGNTDGNFFDGSVTHTNLETSPWWQVDLGASTAISSIVIWNRTDACCVDRLNDYWVFVSDTPFSSTDTPATLQGRAGTFGSHQTAAPNPSATIAASAQGRYVRVQLSGTNNLSLAEVQVFAAQ